MKGTSKPTVLITGCSDGGLGAQLSLAFHEAGWRVFATARNQAKLTTAKDAGIETLSLDTLSEESIQNCINEVQKLTNNSLDMLVNNAGAGHSMPLLDVDLTQARAIYELNVFSLITVTKAFVPLLLNSTRGGIIANNTSGASLPSAQVPFQGAYNSSKAAATSITEVLRLELAPFNIRVVNLITGAVRSTFQTNLPKVSLPDDSMYNVAKEKVEKTLTGDVGTQGQDARKWARKVVASLTKKNPPYWIWEGKFSWVTWFSTFLPVGSLDGVVRGMTGIDVVEKKVKEARKSGMDKKA